MRVRVKVRVRVRVRVRVWEQHRTEVVLRCEGALCGGEPQQRLLG